VSAKRFARSSSSSAAPRAVVDTNVFVSGLIGSLNATAIIAAFRAREFILVLSVDLLSELERVLSRPKFRARLNEREIEELATLIKHRGLLVEPSGELDLCRDPKDNWLLEAATEGEADMIVTGDEDLLVLGEFADIEILRPADFLHRLRAAAS